MVIWKTVAALVGSLSWVLSDREKQDRRRHKRTIFSVLLLLCTVSFCMHKKYIKIHFHFGHLVFGMHDILVIPESAISFFWPRKYVLKYNMTSTLSNIFYILIISLRGKHFSINSLKNINFAWYSVVCVPIY